MKPNDRLVCAFVKPVKVGQEFKDWPLHVTVVPWFRLKDASETIANGLTVALTGIDPFTYNLDELVHFGPRKNRPARLLVIPTPFGSIEQKVRTYLHKKRAWLVDETTKRPRSFRPHVTFQKSGAVEAGDTFTCDGLYIVEQKGDHKEVVAEIIVE